MAGTVECDEDIDENPLQVTSDEASSRVELEGPLTLRQKLIL